MGMKKGALRCQKTTDLVRKWHNQKGYLSTIVLDDMAGAEVVKRPLKLMIVWGICYKRQA